MKNLLYVCLDGLGDDPIPEFDGRTPLEAAETPALDALASRGRTGIVVTVGDGIAPESVQAHVEQVLHGARSFSGTSR